jgi:hypothetical protein
MLLLAGDCKDILMAKYPELALQILNTCMRTLADIVASTKGPRPDKTKCDRLCITTSTPLLSRMQDMYQWLTNTSQFAKQALQVLDTFLRGMVHIIRH